MVLEKKYIFDMELEVITGLHIGGNKDVYEVGGLDNPVIKFKRTGKDYNEPYIPGSSLKGKMRCSLEVNKGLSENGEVCKEDKGNYYIATLFGVGAEKNTTMKKSRITVRDFILKSEYNTDIYEVKNENVIDRKTGTAGNPRPLERVVPGTIFEGSIILDIYDEDKEKEKHLLNNVIESLKLIEDSYLGGCGSRGCGAIKFKNIKLKTKDAKNYLENKKTDEKIFEKLDEITI